MKYCLFVSSKVHSEKSFENNSMAEDRHSEPVDSSNNYSNSLRFVRLTYDSRKHRAKNGTSAGAIEEVKRQ